jgi:hypothetical protein
MLQQIKPKLTVITNQKSTIQAQQHGKSDFLKLYAQLPAEQKILITKLMVSFLGGEV